MPGVTRAEMGSKENVPSGWRTEPYSPIDEGSGRAVARGTGGAVAGRAAEPGEAEPIAGGPAGPVPPQATSRSDNASESRSEGFVVMAAGRGPAGPGSRAHGGAVQALHSGAVTQSSSPGPVQYKGEPLEPARGPGLGCFRFQLVVLAVAVVVTPLSVAWRWPVEVSAGLLILTIVLLLVTGQTIIFLLRLVAADRRTRRRPLGSATKTVGELEDEGAEGAAAAGDERGEPAPDDEGPVRQ